MSFDPNQVLPKSPEVTSRGRAEYALGDTDVQKAWIEGEVQRQLAEADGKQVAGGGSEAWIAALTEAGGHVGNAIKAYVGGESPEPAPAAGGPAASDPAFFDPF